MERYLTEEQDEIIMDLILKETQEAAYIEQCLIDYELFNERQRPYLIGGRENEK